MQLEDALLMKTAKGLMASRADAPDALPAELREVLALVDGKSSLAEIAERAAGRLGPDAVAQRISQLAERGLVSDLPPPEADLTRTAILSTLASVDVGAVTVSIDDAFDDRGPAFGRRKDDLKPEFVAPEEPDLPAQFAAMVREGMAPTLVTRARAQRLLQYALERYIEAKTPPTGDTGKVAEGVDESARRSAAPSPDTRRLLEAVVQREQQARACLREAQARIAEMTHAHQVALEEETRRRESVEQRLQESTAAAADQVAAFEAEIGAQGERIEALAATLAARESDVAQLNAARFSAQEQLASLRGVLDERVAELERARAEVRERDEALAAARQSVADLEGQLEAARQRGDDVCDELASVRRETQAQIASLQYANRMGVERVQDVQGALATVRAELETERDALTVARNRADALEASLEEARGVIAAAEAREREAAERTEAALATCRAADERDAERQAEVTRLGERLVELERQQSQLAEAAEELARNAWQRGRDELLRERADHHAEVKRLVEVIQRLGRSKADVERQRDVFEQEREQARAHASVATAEAAQAEKRMRDALGDLDALREALRGIEREGRSLARVVARVDDVLASLSGPQTSD